MIRVDHREGSMALFDDIPVIENILGGGNWMIGLAIGVGALVVLPLAAPILRPLAKTAIKGGILAYRGAVLHLRVHLGGWPGNTRFHIVRTSSTNAAPAIPISDTVAAPAQKPLAQSSA